ncbi:Transmembrane protein 150A, partial [Pygoscelis adeliae]
YAMALSNNHICPVHNWNYNQSCGVDGPGSCCTLDHIPLVRNYNQSCGVDGPGSCCTLDHIPLVRASCLDPLLVLPAPLPGHKPTPWHRAVLGEHPGVPAAMVSPPQVDHAKVLHYIGAGVAFPTSMLFLLLQSILTYRMAKTRGQYWTGHLRSILAAVAFLTLVFS